MQLHVRTSALWLLTSCVAACVDDGHPQTQSEPFRDARVVDAAAAPLDGMPDQHALDARLPPPDATSPVSDAAGRDVAELPQDAGDAADSEMRDVRIPPDASPVDANVGDARPDGAPPRDAVPWEE